MKNINKDNYKAVYVHGDSVECCLCKEPIDDDEVYVDIAELAQITYQEEDFFETCDTFFDVIDQLDCPTEIYQVPRLCEHCFDNINEPNSKYYEKFLDYIFDDSTDEAIRAKEMYRESMSERLPFNNTGSAKTINTIINALWCKDYYEVDLHGMGEFDGKNYEFVKDIIMKCRGLSVDNLKVGTSLYTYETGYDYTWIVDIERAKRDLEIMQKNIERYEEITNKHITIGAYEKFRSDKKRFKSVYDLGAHKVMKTIETLSYDLYELIAIVTDNEYPKYDIDTNVIAHAYIESHIHMFRVTQPNKWGKILKDNPNLISELKDEVNQLICDIKDGKSQDELSDIEKVKFNISRKLIYKETAFEKMVNDYVYDLMGVSLYDEESIEKMLPKIENFQKSIAPYSNNEKIKITLNVAFKLVEFGDINIGDYESVLDMLKVLSGDNFYSDENLVYGTLYGHKIDVDFDKYLIIIGPNDIEMEPPK